MNKDQIIRMAQKSGAFTELSNTTEKDVEFLRRFADNVRDYLLDTHIHTCHDNCQKFACVQTRNAVKAEREACKKIAVEMANTQANMSKTWRNACIDVANEIEARGRS